MNKTLCFLGIIVLIPVLALSQGSTSGEPSVPRGKRFSLKLEREKASGRGGAASSDLRQILSLKKADVLKLVSERDGASGARYQKYKQYAKRIPVEYSTVSALSRQGSLQSVSGEIYDIPDDLSPVPSIAENLALETALNLVHARSAREKTAPRGELVYVRVYIAGGSKKKDDMALAYKFDIYEEQVPSRDYIFVDAHEGVVIHKDAILKHAEPAPAATRYSGTRTISTLLNNALEFYTLSDDSRGQGIETYNLNHNVTYDNATHFTDGDNDWTAQEFDNANKDNAALDAHWGAMMTYDYFKTKHRRDSYDDNGAKIKSYVHYGFNYVNAFWDGTAMVYGDGNGRVDPLTTLDICGHEIGHAVCQATANLVYENESGALNEGLSDIWGSMIEHYAAPEKSVWDLGEDTKSVFRSLSDPNAYGNPDTYGGDHWYRGVFDGGGVHTNSQVLAHWYYILVTGKAGVNDHGNGYAVNGIGFEAAASIVYGMEVDHLTPNATYADAREASLEAAADLFGAQSNEFRQALLAWDAVGVYDRNILSPSQLRARVASANGIILTWEDRTNQETGFVIERSRNFRGDFVPIETTAANTITYTDNGLAEGIYYYRVKVVLPDSRSARPSATVSVALGVTPLIHSATEVTACDRIFLDPGGVGSYAPRQFVTKVIRPADTGKKVRVSFSSFDLFGLDGVANDQLEIFDGVGVEASSRVGVYTGTTLPPDINATTASGALTFRFLSNDNPGFGWQAQLSCVTVPEPPAHLTAIAFSDSQINLSWEDQSTTETAYRVERGRPPFAPFHEIALLPANATRYENTGLAMDNAYTYRVIAMNGTMYSAPSDTVTAVIGRMPLMLRSGGTVSTCGSVFLDPAGAENYGDALVAVMRMEPDIPGTKLVIDFSAFDLGTNFFDRLTIFDGPAVKTFNGNTLPPRIISSREDGSFTFEFASGFGGHGPGWRAEISCMTIPAAPTDLVATAIASDHSHLTWVDHADDESGYVIERATGVTYVTVTTVGPNTESYEDLALRPDRRYTYRVRAEKADEVRSDPSNTSSVLMGNEPVMMHNGTVTTCSNTFLDSGGDESYGYNEQFKLTIRPDTPGEKVTLDFSSMQIMIYDSLVVYDGASEDAPVLGYYTLVGLPPDAPLTATNPEGELTLTFYSVFSIPVGGWEATISCITPPPLGVETDPGALFKVHPNPASETIRVTSEVYTIRQLSLIDILGRTCLQTTPAQVDCELQVRALNPGIYTLVIQAENNTSVTRRIEIVR